MNQKTNWLYVVLGLFAIYLIIKWTCRLIFGLFDYLILFGVILAIIWYVRLPKERREYLRRQIKARIESIFQ